MSTLICDLRPAAAELADIYRALREAGEPVLLHWPAALSPADVVVVGDLHQLETALDDEQLTCLPPAPNLPAWVPLQECHRVLLVTESGAQAQLTASEIVLLAALFAAGADEVELLSAGAAADLSQSWRSGRRAATVCLTASR